MGEEVSNVSTILLRTIVNTYYRKTRVVTLLRARAPFAIDVVLCYLACVLSK